MQRLKGRGVWVNDARIGWLRRSNNLSGPAVLVGDADPDWFGEARRTNLAGRLKKNEEGWLQLCFAALRKVNAKPQLPNFSRV